MNFICKTIGLRKVLLTIAILYAPLANASGLGAPEMSASGLGVANAMTASADDASAMAYNPAGIAWSTGTHFMVGSVLRWRNAAYQPAGALLDIGINTGHSYLTRMQHGSKIGGGLAWTLPFAINNNWSKVGRTAVRVNRLSADLVVAVNSSLAFSLGPDWHFGQMDLTTIAGQSFQGTSHNALGGHASVMWKPWPLWSFGMLYRSSANMRFSGNNATAKLKLPDSLRIGLSRRIGANVRLELDGKWTHWKSLNSIQVVRGNTLLQSRNLDLRNTIDIMTGLSWSWREDTRFRFGYAYEQGASKSNSFNPAITDLSGHRFSLGAGSNLFGVHMDVAYSYLFQPSKTARSSASSGLAAGSSGKLKHRRQSLAISISQYF
ncbi:MAG: outer membrane protein transport protein [Mariprofundales bacterium]|nr:outer membrane protein transport protein [Mariprofundales bacterium]